MLSKGSRLLTTFSGIPVTQNPSVGSNNIPNPYPTEGGHVPIYSMVNGFVQKRNWIFRNPQWCDLCKEPVALWVNHHGRKDHALMDMHYTMMMEFPRRWNPKVVLETFFDELDIPVQSYQRKYSLYDKEHRNELYAILMKLGEVGMLHFGEPRQTFLSRMQGGLRGMDHQGALVLHRFILGPFMRLYPNAHIQDFSNLVDFVTCAYNMETVYDLCGFNTLDKIAIKSNFKASSPAALGLGGIAVHSSATTGFEQHASGVSSTDANHNLETKKGVPSKNQEDLDEEAFSRKAVFVRQLLGQLRWLTLPEKKHPAGQTFPEHILLLGEICIKSLVAEIVASRLCEYMVRVEPVWRDFGFERRKLDMKKIANQRNDILPEPVKFFYRPMSKRYDDLYTVKEGSLDKAARALATKVLPNSNF